MISVQNSNRFFFFQHDNLMQKITRLEKQVEQEKRLNTNLTAEIESCRRESRLLQESSLASSQDQTKQVKLHSV